MTDHKKKSPETKTSGFLHWVGELFQQVLAPIGYFVLGMMGR
jgi:hypothetical protein